MARALLVVERTAGRCALGPYVEVLRHRLMPDNLAPKAPAVARRAGVTAVVFEPSGAARLEGESICLGTFFGPSGDWRRPGTEPAPGCYALLRSDASRAELVADAAATRTIWYAMTPELFVASTSQRAIVTLLGSFEPSAPAVSWMLSSGTLGPDTGWDTRLRQVLPGERVVLDRARWRLTNDAPPIVFEPSAHDEAQHRERLASAIEDALGRYSFDADKWVFLLSGGIDSRGLLTLLHARGNIRTVTWGLRDSPHRPLNDARFASRAAAAFGVAHRFFATDLADLPRELLVRRFLVAGEGRTASISPFVDGFAVWKTLREEGFDGAIRGDEAFGQRLASSAYDVRHLAKLTMLTDYFSAAEVESFELPDQRLPPWLAQRRGETLATWRDRLYQRHRLPKFLAALSDLVSPYIEVANPLLADGIVRCVRTLPDHLRTGKRLWRQIAWPRTPNVPLAHRPAVLPLQRFVSDTQVLEVMLEEIEASRGNDVMGPALRRRIGA
ncbi:MAG TPA: asparagine synthase-related protein, partial [Gammaproteobacteria bacterium]|nr:asparagine synthase-related protein [Gammaproteobacteria bacterium]